MESLLQKQTVPVIHAVLDKSEEYILSSDFVLPEYCPDVAVVLKCTVTPYIHNRQWSGNQLLLDGTASVRVLYLDEERRSVRMAEFSHPISCSMRAEDALETPMASLEIRQEYVNCRATSPRRLELRGAFSIHADAKTRGTIELATGSQQERLCMRTAQVAVSAPKASTERVMALNDVIDFDSSLPPAEQLLGGECYAAVQECKLLTGKAIVKGQVYIHQLYTDDSAKGSLHVLEHTLPFSQILDLDGAQDTDLCTADVMILSDTERCVLNAQGQNAALEVSLKMLMQVQVYESATVPIILDSYHTDYPATLKTQDLLLRSFLGTQRQSATVQRTMELPSGDIQEILDVWVQPITAPGSCENKTALITGRMMVCMLARDTNGMIAYYERPEEFNLEYPVQGDTICTRESVNGITFTVSDGHLELHISLCISISQWLNTEQRVVQEVTLRQEEAYPIQRAVVRLYYAQPGERVWDIARECHTSPDGIMQENGLSDEVLSDKAVLVVPVC